MAENKKVKLRNTLLEIDVVICMLYLSRNYLLNFPTPDLGQNILTLYIFGIMFFVLQGAIKAVLKKFSKDLWHINLQNQFLFFVPVGVALLFTNT